MAARSAILDPILTNFNRLRSRIFLSVCVKFRRNQMKNATCRVFTKKERKKQSQYIPSWSTYLAKWNFAKWWKRSRRATTWRMMRTVGRRKSELKTTRLEFGKVREKCWSPLNKLVFGKVSRDQSEDAENANGRFPRTFDLNAAFSGKCTEWP